jgi:hypothetical protein
MGSKKIAVTGLTLEADLQADDMFFILRGENNPLYDITDDNLYPVTLAYLTTLLSSDLPIETLTTVERDALVTPPIGKLILNSTTSEIQLHFGSGTWITLLDKTAFAQLAGISGGQEIIGGADASDDLTLTSTSDTTKGNIIIGGVATVKEELDLLNVTSVPEHADNAAAVTATLVVGDVYRTGDILKIVHA